MIDTQSDLPHTRQMIELSSLVWYVPDESRNCFEAGLAPAETADRIELGPYGDWKAPQVSRDSGVLSQ